MISTHEPVADALRAVRSTGDPADAADLALGPLRRAMWGGGVAAGTAVRRLRLAIEMLDPEARPAPDSWIARVEDGDCVVTTPVIQNAGVSARGGRWRVLRRR